MENKEIEEGREQPVNSESPIEVLISEQREPAPEQEEITQDEPLIDKDTVDSDLPVEETAHEEEMPELAQEELIPSADFKERLAAIEEALKQSNQLFDNKLLYDKAKEEMITKLHKELQVYKDDFHKKLVKPIIMDMIVFADSMKALASRYEEIPEAEMMPEKYQKLRAEFLKVGEHINDLIYNYGVEPFYCEAGSDFDSKIQQSKKTSLVESEEDNKKIIASLNPGYCWDDQILRKEYVHVGLKEAGNN